MDKDDDSVFDVFARFYNRAAIVIVVWVIVMDVIVVVKHL